MGQQRLRSDNPSPNPTGNRQLVSDTRTPPRVKDGVCFVILFGNNLLKLNNCEDSGKRTPEEKCTFLSPRIRLFLRVNMYNVVHNAHCILRLSARSFSYMVQQDYTFSPLGLGIEPYQRRNFVLVTDVFFLRMHSLSLTRRMST